MSNLVESYGWQSERGTHSSGYIAPFVLEWVKRARVKRVLDLGAGNGHLCGELARAGVDVVGVEYDAEGVRIAQSSHPTIPFYQFGVQDDPALLLAKEAPFDLVISTEVIEHLFAPRLLPRYARNVLRPDGRLLITTPYHGYLKNLALAVAGKCDAHWGSLWTGGHIKFWSRPTLTKLLDWEGFSVTEFHGIGRAPYLWRSMAVVASLKT